MEKNTKPGQSHQPHKPQPHPGEQQIFFAERCQKKRKCEKPETRPKRKATRQKAKKTSERKKVAKNRTTCPGATLRTPSRAQQTPPLGNTGHYWGTLGITGPTTGHCGHSHGNLSPPWRVNTEIKRWTDKYSYLPFMISYNPNTTRTPSSFFNTLLYFPITTTTITHTQSTNT